MNKKERNEDEQKTGKEYNLTFPEMKNSSLRLKSFFLGSEAKVMTDLHPALNRQFGRGRTASWNWPFANRLAMSVSKKLRNKFIKNNNNILTIQLTVKEDILSWNTLLLWNFFQWIWSNSFNIVLKLKLMTNNIYLLVQ